MRQNDPRVDRGSSRSIKITSRYAEYEGVQIDPMKVPPTFRDLIPLAIFWSIGDDVERIKLMESTSDEQLSMLIQNIQPFDDEIWRWCSSHHADVPIPHEVVIFDGLLQAAAEAKKMLEITSANRLPEA